MFSKRLWACLLGGVASAVICLAGSQILNAFPVVTWEDAAARVANRILLGFVIGISGWRIHHLLHGAILGFLLSLSVSIGFLPDNLAGFLLYTSAGILYGLLIEWLSTDVLKAPMK